MQRKMSFFLIVAMLNCCINGMKEIVPDNEYVIAYKAAGCIVVEAADIENITETTEDIEGDKAEEDKNPIEHTETDLRIRMLTISNTQN